jgi:pyruvate dehydrogenase E2 component (dihydrolipoamide acetyltransferase)
MPAMSPTMTEGGISAWKKAEGEAFSSLVIVCASLLHSIQGLTMHPRRKLTKAVIDLEAQEDGVLAKIVVCDIPVMALTSRSPRIHVIGPGRLEECCCR